MLKVTSPDSQSGFPSTSPTTFTLGFWVLTYLSCFLTQVEARGGSRA